MGKKNKTPEARLQSLIADVDAELLKTLLNESDRGCVLVATSFIEEALEHAMRRYLRQISPTAEEDIDWLLTSKPMAPLGTFHARILTCHVLAIIDSTLKSAMIELKQIRNLFAHRGETEPRLTNDVALRLLNKTNQSIGLPNVKIHQVTERFTKQVTSAVTEKMQPLFTLASLFENDEILNAFIVKAAEDIISKEQKNSEPRLLFILAVSIILERLKLKSP